VLVERLRREHHDATHVVFAWRIGWPPAERSSDAGEPAGTAGPPILAALRGAGLSDVAAVVVRYFGGTKLGRGGLARAYGDVVHEALVALPTHAERLRRRILVEAPYERLGALRRLLVPERVELVAERFGAAVEIELAVAEEEVEALRGALAGLRLASREP